MAVLTGPGRQWLGPFLSMAATNKSLRERTNLRTGSERLRGVGPPVVVARPPTDAQVIAGVVLGVASCLLMGGVGENNRQSDPDDSHLYCHLLDLHGYPTSGRRFSPLLP